MTNNETIAGRLISKAGETYILTQNGEKKFTQAAIWHGYLQHFQNQRVLGRLLPQTDYETGRPIALLWPETKKESELFLEIYFNERLPNYLGSIFGHSAININGQIFNFAHKLNENEVLTWEEYFFRPAMGEFAPGPNGKYDISNPHRPYYDKFGRRFMRTVVSLRVTGIKNTSFLLKYFHASMKKIKTQTVKAHAPDINHYFNLAFYNCVTELHAGLTAWGLKNLHNRFPLDFFLSCKQELTKLAAKQRWRISVAKLPQFKVPEAPWSKPVRPMSLRFWFNDLN
jgi:hypothetical protein